MWGWGMEGLESPHLDEKDVCLKIAGATTAGCLCLETTGSILANLSSHPPCLKEFFFFLLLLSFLQVTL